MRVLFDTNVLIDFLSERAPFVADATDLLARAYRGQIQGLACATSFTTVFYVLRKELGGEAARDGVSRLLSVLDVAPVSRAVLVAATTNAARDFEDAVVMESARVAGAEHIVTRNVRDFASSPVPVHSPAELRGLLDLVQ